jgi:hypothetical protein
MRLRDEASDPWGLIIGAAAGGLAWATGIPVIAAAGIGAAVYGVKVISGLFDRRRGGGKLQVTGAGGRPLAVNRSSPESWWLERGRQAVRSFDDLAGSMAAGPLAERVAQMRSPVAETVATLERLAGQASAAGTALGRLDPKRLEGEKARLRDERRRAKGDAVEYFERALKSVDGQLEVVQRLSSARSGILVRMESSVLELEGVVARLVELTAMATGPATEVGQLEQVADELEGVRRGLAEAEELSRRVLRAYSDTEPKEL